MRCILFRLLKKIDSHDGNATLGFALVAPLLVTVFTVVLQLVAIARERAILMGIAHDASRIASTANASPIQGVAVGRSELGTGSSLREQASIKVVRLQYGGVHYVQTTVTETYPVAWLGKSVMLTVNARSLDESSL